jgi:hypothetical protein
MGIKQNDGSTMGVKPFLLAFHGGELDLGLLPFLLDDLGSAMGVQLIFMGFPPYLN